MLTFLNGNMSLFKFRSSSLDIVLLYVYGFRQQGRHKHLLVIDSVNTRIWNILQYSSMFSKPIGLGIQY